MVISTLKFGGKIRRIVSLVSQNRHAKQIIITGSILIICFLQGAGAHKLQKGWIRQAFLFLSGPMH